MTVRGKTFLVEGLTVLSARKFLKDISTLFLR